MKKGFNAYEEINKTAKAIYGDNVHVEAAIFGDEYIIRDGEYKELFKGTTTQTFAHFVDQLKLNMGGK